MFEGTTNSSFPHNWENMKLIRSERAKGCDVLGTNKTPGGSGTKLQQVSFTIPNISLQ